ncbi:MAG: betaine/proline/choline family ABC transporter ATP-binding protein [Trueperaceae bacterium]
MIQVERLFKIFGERPQEILGLLEEGKGKDEIHEETGHVVGVQDVSFGLERGEVFVIMGLSGSGKSTLLRCVNRLIEPTAGRVVLQTDDGEVDVTSLDSSRLRAVRKRNMSMVFQRFGLFPHRDVLDNVAYGLEVQGMATDDRRRAAGEILDLVGLGGWGTSYPDELSGGMQQRVGLGRALATQAPVLLMDEPFSALDPLIKVDMQDELLRIQEELHRTMLFITHDLDEALRIGSHIAIMESGRIVQKGTPEEIIVNPKTKYVADFVEHADSTGVITAATVAQALPGPRFERVASDGKETSYARRGFPTVRVVVGNDRRLVRVESAGKPVQLRDLDEVLSTKVPEIRSQVMAVRCRPDASLREVLEGRTYTNMPALVVDSDDRLVGVVGERELVQGILEKRAPSSPPEEQDAGESVGSRA